MRLLSIVLILVLSISIGGPLLLHHLSKAKPTTIPPAAVVVQEGTQQAVQTPPVADVAPAPQPTLGIPTQETNQAEVEEVSTKPETPKTEAQPSEAFTIRGEVVESEEWQGVANVQVFAIAWDDSLVNHHSIFNLHSRAMAITDESGHFEFKDLNLTRYGLITYHRSYIQTETATKYVIDPESDSDPEADDKSVLITMEKGGGVRGMASYGGKPLSGQQVILAYAFGTHVQEAATTDSDGSYVFEGLREGRVKVGLTVDTDIGPLEIAFSVRVENGETTVVDLPLEGRDAAIFGLISPFDPEIQYMVSAFHLDQTLDQYTYTGEIASDGSFLFSELPYGRFRVVLESRRAGKLQRRENQRVQATVRTFPGQIARHDFYFSDGYAAEGVVSNAALDEPLSVFASKDLRIDNPTPRILKQFRESPSTHYAYVDADGGFHFEDLDPGTYQIVAEGGPNRYGMATIHVASRPSRSSGNPRPYNPVELWLEDN